MIAASVPTMRPHHDHAWRAVVARFDDDDWSGTVAVVVGMRIARVIRSADDNLSAEVRVSKTQRHANPRLSGGDAGDGGSETKHECESDHDAFHTCLLGACA